MKLKVKQSSVAAAIAAAIGISTVAQPNTVSATTLSNGFYEMQINNTPYVTGTGYNFGSDGAWNSSFTLGCLPGTKGCGSRAMYDDTISEPVNGRYAGRTNDGVQGSLLIKVVDGIISTDPFNRYPFNFDTVRGTAGGDFTEYGDPNQLTGTIDSAGNISLTATDLLATFGDFPALVDERWNVDNFNGGVGIGTSFVPNPVNSNIAYDAFSTGTATNLGYNQTAGEYFQQQINGAAYDGTSAILVKGGQLGSDWDGAFGVSYFEVWNISFDYADCFDMPGLDCFAAPVPIPAAIWLFGSGLLGMLGTSRRKREPHESTSRFG